MTSSTVSNCPHANTANTDITNQNPKKFLFSKLPENEGTPQPQQPIVMIKWQQEIKQQMPISKDIRELWEESSFMECKDIWTCPCIERVTVLLQIYGKFQTEIMEEMGGDIDTLFETNNYNKTCLENDFQYIHQVHSDRLDDIVRERRKRVKCTYKGCFAAARRRDSNGAISSDTASSGRNLMDKIHSYFLHSWQIPEEIKPIPLETNYDGRDDKKWIETIDHLDPNDEIEQLPVYERLVKKVGIFSWQSATGLENNGVLSHLKPKYANIKEEALNKSYCKESIENWNSTLRKSTDFNKTWCCKKIRTQHNGYYDDMLLGNHDTWDRNESPDTKEVMTLKLYTDWSDLQFELKNCFRLEQPDKVGELNYSNEEMARTPRPKTKANTTSGSPPSPSQHFRWESSHLKLPMPEDLVKSTPSELSLEDKKRELEERLKEFYHWRGGLLILSINS